MANLIEQAIDCDDAKLIRDALGIESDEVANYVFPKTWPANREQRARIIGEWLKAEARFLIAPSIVPVPGGRFPPPWIVEETTPCFIVRDHNGQTLAFVYCEDDHRRRTRWGTADRGEYR